MSDLASAAEEAGWDAVLLEDYLAYHMHREVPTSDTWMLLAMMATRTRRLVLGTAVTPLPRRQPWKVARELLTLDHISQGRAVLGVGLGDLNDPSWRAVGDVTDLTQRAQMVDESLEIIDGLCRSREVTFEGIHYRVDKLALRPASIQQPRPPIWIGAYLESQE